MDLVSKVQQPFPIIKRKIYFHYIVQFFIKVLIFLKSNMIVNIQIKSYLHLATQSSIKVYQFQVLTNTDSILKSLLKINGFFMFLRFLQRQE